MGDQRWILDGLSVGIWVGNVPAGNAAYANAAFERILGMPSVPSSQIDDVPDTYGIFDRAGQAYPVEKLPFSRVVATGQAVVVDDIVAKRPSGDVYIRAFGSPIRDAGGTLTHVIVAFIDITKQVEVEAERDRVEDQLKFVVDHSPVAVWAMDASGTIALSEGAGLAALGVKSGELVGKDLFEIYKDHPTISGYVRRALAGDSFWYTVEVGAAVYETWLAPRRDAAGKIDGVVGLSKDVTQVHTLQKTAIQNDRVMALGTLAASVAHEINNPLTYLLGFGDSIDAELGALGDMLNRLDGAALPAARAALARIKEQVTAVRSGTARIAEITRDLRTFSRPEEGSLSPVDLRAVVASVLKLIGKEIDARARLVVDLQDAPSRVIGNEGRLVQVVLNLVMNAMQALPPGPVVANEIAVRTRRDGAHAIIEVADSGPGVPVADRERIFEPFFSTKEIGKGTGLGLFVCRNIVRGFSGEVEVGDRPGGGALFRVTLPAAPAGAAAPAPGRAPAARPAPPAPPVPSRPGAHVIVIEDDPMVSRALAVQLRAAGYEVTVIGDGQAGMAAMRAHRQVDLVFCDLMMTGMTGMDVAEVLEREAPELARKVVFMTGGAFSPRAREFVARHADDVVEKPFNIVEETRRRLGGR
jgi:PAS domain S-box-containing protein